MSTTASNGPAGKREPHHAIALDTPAPLDVKGVEALSHLPGKDELRATFLATLLAVPQNFLRLTTAAQQNFALLLAARERALGEEGKK